MKHSAWATAALAVSATLVVAACGSSSSSAPSSSGSSGAAAGSSSSSSSGATTTAKFTGCMVADTGTIDDRSFNQSAWEGMQEAASSDPSVTVKYLPSSQSTNAVYQSNINTFIGEKCGIIVTVGYLMATVTASAAKANASDDFAIVDNPGAPVIKNQSSLVFDTVQDGFLGGYLAAGMSKTGKVATFGGQELPTVTIYMDGFWDGVQYYNKQHHTNVQVLGWNEQSQKGEFTNSFTDETAGQTTTQTFISEGADVIFPVAGDVGLGAAKAVENADNAAGSTKVTMEWVDTDGCVSAPSYCKYFITSVTKGIQTAVKHDVVAAANKTFTGGNYIGTLANGGVLLAPYHDFANVIPQALQSELKQVQSGIESGSIQTPTKSPVTG
ncbi:MAG TPA: BMP family ABC transporter substrate-binding protein [Streptosporangiaceae bacterium]